jgi:hypothetical protein
MKYLALSSRMLRLKPFYLDTLVQLQRSVGRPKLMNPKSLLRKMPTAVQARLDLTATA